MVILDRITEKTRMFSDSIAYPETFMGCFSMVIVCHPHLESDSSVATGVEVVSGSLNQSTALPPQTLPS